MTIYGAYTTTTPFPMTYYTHTNPKLAADGLISIQPAPHARKSAEVYHSAHVFGLELSRVLLSLHSVQGGLVECVVRAVELWYARLFACLYFVFCCEIPCLMRLCRVLRRISSRWPQLLSNSSSPPFIPDPDRFVPLKTPSPDAISPYMHRVVAELLSPLLLRLCRLHRHTRHQIYAGVLSGVMNSLVQFAFDARMKFNRQGATQLEYVCYLLLLLMYDFD